MGSHSVALDYIQLLDLDLLLSVAAYDDNKAIEAITDRVQECKRYAFHANL